MCQGLVHVLISASQHLRMECVDSCLKEENGRCLFELPVQNPPAEVLVKLDERLQKMEKLVIYASHQRIPSPPLSVVLGIEAGKEASVPLTLENSKQKQLNCVG